MTFHQFHHNIIKARYCKDHALNETDIRISKCILSTYCIILGKDQMSSLFNCSWHLLTATIKDSSHKIKGYFN